MPSGSIRAAAGALALADRISDEWIDVSKVNDLEMLAGEAALTALVATSMEGAQTVDITGNTSVWAD